MDFEMDEEQRLLQRTVRKYMEQNVIPIVPRHEKDHKFAWHLLPELQKFGYIGGLLPEEAGGMNLSYVLLAILMEEAGRAWPSLRVIVNILCIMPLMLYRHGNEYHKKKFLKPLMNSEKRFWFAATEPNAGSNVVGIETTARRESNFYRVNGTKTFITNGSIAECGLLLAYTDKTKGSKGISTLLIEKDTCPYTHRDIEKMFIRATTTSELFFEDCLVPVENLLGNEGEGLKIALAGLNVGRLNVAMGAVGIAEACLEHSIKYTQERTQFGKKIGSFQLIQEMIAEMACLTEGARLLGFNAAQVLDKGKGQRGSKECSIAKLFASESAFKVANLALQVHGGYGYTEEFPIERYFRDARGTMIPEGTSQIQTLIIGREVLGTSAIV